VKNGGTVASINNPGGGWIGAGMVSQSASKFLLYWKNTDNQHYHYTDSTFIEENFAKAIKKLVNWVGYGGIIYLSEYSAHLF
jgi:23S rRNA G2069 N7-methylase RlmK/C1962 C5-methylase RlmI